MINAKIDTIYICSLHLYPYAYVSDEIKIIYLYKIPIFIRSIIYVNNVDKSLHPLHPFPRYSFHKFVAFNSSNWFF